MIAKYIEIFIILFHICVGTWAEESFFEFEEQHDNQVPLLRSANDISHSKAIIRQRLIGKLFTAVKQQKPGNLKNNLISGTELLEIRDLLADEKYKPWGAAALPSDNMNNQEVILDKVDDELFTPNSERHSYDERTHEEAKIRLLFDRL